MSSTQAYYEVGSTGLWAAKLVRDDGSRVPLADIDSATLVLRDVATGTIVNDRGTAETPQDVWASGDGDHGFHFEETTDDNGDPITRVGWDIETEDVAPLRPIAARETHLAELVVAYHLGGPPGTPKRIRHRHALECIEPRRLLCTLDDISGYLPDIDVDKHGPLLLRLIEAHQRRAEAYCERFFLRSTDEQPTTQEFTVDCGQRVVLLNRYPVTRIVDVIEAVDGEWVEGLTLTAAEDYWLDAETGGLEVRFRSLQKGAGALRVRYVGGMFSDVSELDQSLREAIAQQVAFKYQRKGQLGLGSIGMAGTSITVSAVQDWLPDSRAVLDDLRNVDV